MTGADRVGLLSGFRWITDHSWLSERWANANLFVTILICLLIAPVGVWIVQLIFEFTVPSLKPSDNYLSFLYGDPMLGVMTGVLLSLSSKRLPDEPRWYNSSGWHMGVLIFMIAASLVLTWLDYRTGQFTMRELLAPSKLYHNLVLYGPYGYVIVTTLVAYVAGNPWSQIEPRSLIGFMAAIGCGVVWIWLVVHDSSLADGAKQVKEQSSAVRDDTEASEDAAPAGF